MAISQMRVSICYTTYAARSSKEQPGTSRGFTQRVPTYFIVQIFGSAEIDWLSKGREYEDGRKERTGHELGKALANFHICVWGSSLPFVSLHKAGKDRRLNSRRKHCLEFWASSGSHRGTGSTPGWEGRQIHAGIRNKRKGRQPCIRVRRK